jgi:hypothetical protein
MLAFRRMLILAVVCLVNLAVAQNQWQQGNDNAAARVLGPRWQQISRDSGMIFSGIVLAVHTPHSGDQEVIPTVEITFRVERAIAGVRPSQVLTIREWAGAWPEHPVRKGQRVLLLLYPRSRLGLTSPVGGALGQIELNRENIVIRPTSLAHGDRSSRTSRISLSQLERVIRGDRTSHSTRTMRGRKTTEKE